MQRLKQTAAAYLSATLIVAASCQLSAFEQGTYFIYQVVGQSDTPAIGQRLTANSQLFVQLESTSPERTAVVAELSEFEIDYNYLGTTIHSGLESTQPTSTGPPPSSNASPFDTGTQEAISLFGN